MKIKIYQIAPEKDKRHLMFSRFEFAEKHGGIDPSEYDLVFEGEVKAEDLEDVYIIFNDYVKMPASYHGRSLSVSDVVETEDGAYFCNSFGFIKLPSFQKGE
jgi:hypothetical protein